MSGATDAAIGIAVIGGVTGIVGAGTGVVSLRRQAAYERRADAIVVVRARWGLAAFPDGPHGTISVEASNQGRGSIQVTGWGFVLPDGQQMIFPQPMHGSDSIPKTLDGGHAATWHAELRNAPQLLAMNDAGDLDLVPFVHLGTRETVEGKALRTDQGMMRRIL